MNKLKHFLSGYIQMRNAFEMWQDYINHPIDGEHYEDAHWLFWELHLGKCC